jgi:serine phosphatase RsbU (regulator of sigma subunit)
MPSLLLLRCPTDPPPPPGFVEGRVVGLSADPQTIGRKRDDCQICIEHTTVSKLHARITTEGGRYFIEDLKSRNFTFVNGRKAQPGVRVPLRSDDHIDICDFRFRFCDEAEDAAGISTIEATQGKVNLQQYLEGAPSDRLRALVDVSSSLAKTLDLDALLAQVAETQLALFAQAERCFVLLLDAAGKPTPKVVKHRKAGSEDLRFSRSVARKTVESLQSYLSEDASSDPGAGSVMGSADSIADLKTRSVMCVPLATAEGRALGAIQLDTQDRAKKFVADDLNLLAIVANLASVAIEKARLHAELVALEVERSENRTARKVQLSLLPKSLPELPGYEFYAYYSPAEEVGGDYYDFVSLPGGRVAVVLGDVAGKGVPAALLVAKLSSEVRFCLVTEPDLAKAITLLNDELLHGGLEELSGQFITLSVMILDPVSHQVTLVNAGHESPRLYSASRSTLTDVLTEEQIGCVLGWEDGVWCNYRASTFALEPGDTVIVYTDGVTDAWNPAEQPFGKPRVDRSLHPNTSAPEAARPRAIGARLVAAVEKHAAGRAQNDDIALVCFGRLPAGQGGEPGTPAPIRPTTTIMRRRK